VKGVIKILRKHEVPALFVAQGQIMRFVSEAAVKENAQQSEETVNKTALLRQELTDYVDSWDLGADKLIDGTAFAGLRDPVTNMLERAVEFALGGTNESRRTNDLQDILNEYAQKQAEAKAVEPTKSADEPVDGETASEGADAAPEASTSTEPANG